ncbi:MAG: SDR family oxidoreductase [Rhodospirillales bacterium]|nr:SDR family oxidoreductase [Rhodospirillales bacterium]
MLLQDRVAIVSGGLSGIGAAIAARFAAEGARVAAADIVAESEQLTAAGRGAVVTIASVSAQRGNAGRAAYSASTGGVIALTQVMATELAPHGIRVNALAPGPIATLMTAGAHDPAARRRWLGLTPLGRFGTAEEVAAAALFLASDEASFITGHVLNVDGGWQESGMPPERGGS